VRVICVILPLVGCSRSLPVPSDLAAPADDLSVARDLSVHRDLSFVRDLSPPPDLTVLPDLAFTPWTPVNPATFCGGPDGGLTCAQDFFVRLLNCYQPAGYCGHFDHNSGQVICFESGAQGTNYIWALPGRVADFVHGDMLCAINERLPSGMFKWTLWDGTLLYVDPPSGAAFCDSGEAANVGIDYGACADVKKLALVVGPCPEGPIPCYGSPASPSPTPSPSP
jgi:hypothetical protein